MDGGINAWLANADLSYPGWKEDYEIAQVACNEGGISGASAAFRNSVHRLNEKQRAFEGDRSHPRLVALDELSLSYPCWEDDVQNAEKAHFDNQYDFNTEDVYFHSKLEGLQNRQQLYYGYNADQTRARASTGPASNGEITALLGPCAICGERDKTHLFDPCGHLCACQSCANTVTGGLSTARSCPVCRVPCTKIIKVYFT